MTRRIKDTLSTFSSTYDFVEYLSAVIVNEVGDALLSGWSCMNMKKFSKIASRQENLCFSICITYAPLIILYPLEMALPPTRECGNVDKQ